MESDVGTQGLTRFEAGRRGSRTALTRVRGTARSRGMHYKIAAARKIADLEAQVNALLEQGFELHGSPFVSARDFFCQALIERTPPLRRERRKGDE